MSEIDCRVRAALQVIPPSLEIGQNEEVSSGAQLIRCRCTCGIRVLWQDGNTRQPQRVPSTVENVSPSVFRQSQFLSLFKSISRLAIGGRCGRFSIIQRAPRGGLLLYTPKTVS
ncbi:hypothetical protein NPIL_402201 [Nephila pilipes]|uniref:Uncharacterized protein n=1 Tax=Nephila pilipes TaxID=299642 RepID=A0A8X6T3E2_NEPPI|nr:hypothetical protein NPIL_402201 [Nephila pilipes]